MFLFGPAKSLVLQASNKAVGSIGGTTENSLFPDVVGQKMFPADWFQPGANARFVLRGSVTSPLIPGTTTIRVKVGGVTIATATSTSLIGSVTGGAFSVVGNLQCYTTGTSATFGLGGVVTYPVGLVGFGGGQAALNSDSVTFDSTIQQSFDVTTQWSLGSHSIKINIATLELMPVA